MSPPLVAHVTLMLVSVSVLLPLGIFLVRRGSWMHKPWQFLTLIIMTVSIVIMHHPDSNSDGSTIHKRVGWTLIGGLWTQVVLGWLTSTSSPCYSCYSRSCSRPQMMKQVHKWLGYVYLLMLWGQILLGMYTLLDIFDSPHVQQMLAHTSIGIGFIGTGCFYLYANEREFRQVSIVGVEALLMIVGGALLGFGELMGMQKLSEFIHNQHILAAGMWVLCGVLGSILFLEEAGYFTRRQFEEHTWTPIPTTIGVNGQRLSTVTLFPAMLVIICHSIFILMHSQHMESMTMLHRIHILFLFLALICRVGTFLRSSSYCLMFAGVTFMASQSGLCTWADEMGLDATIWILLTLCVSLLVVLFIQVYTCMMKLSSKKDVLVL
jgi:hypothetical protein